MKLLSKVAIISAVTMSVAVAVSFSAGFILVNTALTPEDHGQNLEADRTRWEKRIPGIISWYDSLRAADVFRDTFITASDGVRLHAVYAGLAIPAPTAVLVHGYTDNHLGMIHLARMYRDSLGMNVLIPDNRHHGLSGGEAIQMGWLDRLDVKRWVVEAHGIFGGDFFVLHGVSMGGAATMMTAGEPDLPDYLCAFIEDCGYCDVWGQFAKELKERYHLPAFPVLHCADLVCRMRYGWGFREASSVRQLASCTRPVLFIHGDSDAFVPTADVYRNFAAPPIKEKRIWLAPDTAHARAYENNPAAYTATVRDFLTSLF